MRILKAKKRCIPQFAKCTHEYIECRNCHLLVCYNSVTSVQSSLLIKHFQLCELKDTRDSWVGKFASGVIVIGSVPYVSDWYADLQG